MRIVDICGFYTPHGGGIRTYVEQKLAMADALGQDITILAPDAERTVREVSASARIIGVPSPRFPLDRKYFAFTEAAPIHRELDVLEPDFVEASSPWRSASIAMSWRPEVPKSFIMHSEPLSAHVYRWFERLAEPEAVDRQFDWFWERLREFGRTFSAVICANSHLASRMTEGGVGNVHNIPMGVQPGVFGPSYRDEALRRELLAECSLGPDATLLLAAGRLANEKRLPMLVEAATRAGAERPIGFVIFGEGRAHNKIMRAIAGNPHIRLFRPVRDRERFATILASADALLHGCEAETFGMTTAEARASGIPVIAPDRGGASDFSDGPLQYRAVHTEDAVRAILSLPESFAEVPPTTKVRSMEDHFTELFGLYERIAAKPARTYAA